MARVSIYAYDGAKKWEGEILARRPVCDAYIVPTALAMIETEEMDSTIKEEFIDQSTGKLEWRYGLKTVYCVMFVAERKTGSYEWLSGAKNWR